MLTALRSQNQPLQLELGRLDTPQFPGSLLWPGGQKGHRNGPKCTHLALDMQSLGAFSCAGPWREGNCRGIAWLIMSLSYLTWKGKVMKEEHKGMGWSLPDSNAKDCRTGRSGARWLKDPDGSKGVILPLLPDSLNWVLPGRFLEHSHENHIWSGFPATLQTQLRFILESRSFFWDKNLSNVWFVGVNTLVAQIPLLAQGSTVLKVQLGYKIFLWLSQTSYHSHFLK